MSDPIDREQSEPLPTDPVVFWNGGSGRLLRVGPSPCPVCYGRRERRVYHGEPSQGHEWVPCEVCRSEREEVPL